ncbi:acyltransferase [Paenibacillus sp. 7516]|uniref:acyltransferase family protein n=1 Tax=Paenibacillus sp. 7516 TaxID=2022549 RepID=UPI001483C334|nr:acyltransferase [Paenibacillus sp. 7516]
MRKERLFYLDFIRALSVLAIVVYHFSTTLSGLRIESFLSIPWNYANGNLSTIGVSLFFSISGAALMYSYNDKFSLRQYFAKRFLSIYPIFWIAYIVAFLYLFYVNKTTAHVPNISFFLTIFGMDGYMLYSIPNYYILGEWFLGCIILLYLCFPVLRFFVLRYPIITFIAILVLYLVFVENYVFKLGINRNFLTRIPELLIGMYFTQFIRKVKWYHFLIASIITALMLFVKIDINQMYKVTIVGISVFFVLAYIAQFIRSNKIMGSIQVVSKYSFAVFLVHHVIMMQLAKQFKGMNLTTVETLSLLLITILIIVLFSLYLHKISNKVILYASSVTK